MSLIARLNARTEGAPAGLGSDLCSVVRAEAESQRDERSHRDADRGARDHVGREVGGHVDAQMDDERRQREQEPAIEHTGRRERACPRQQRDRHEAGTDDRDAPHRVRCA